EAVKSVDALTCRDAFLAPLQIDDAVKRALAEDLGRAGDITSIATIPPDAVARGLVVARRSGIIAGLPVAAAVFRTLAPEIAIAAHAGDGAAVAAKTPLMEIAGPARAVLAGERVALNFLGHLSGVATATAEFVRRVAHTRTRVTCTRKTAPGLRALQKYAVRCGGGFNHRFGLDDPMLIKDHHIAVAGGIAGVLARARAVAGHLVKIEIEVDSLDQLREVMAAGGADVVLLDNMDPPTLRQAVEMVAGTLVTEASGGITLDTVAEIAETGVDYVSSGSITHSVINLDVGLDIAMAGARPVAAWPCSPTCAARAAAAGSDVLHQFDHGAAHLAVSELAVGPQQAQGTRDGEQLERRRRCAAAVGALDRARGVLRAEERADRNTEHLGDLRQPP